MRATKRECIDTIIVVVKSHVIIHSAIGIQSGSEDPLDEVRLHLYPIFLCRFHFRLRVALRLVVDIIVG